MYRCKGNGGGHWAVQQLVLPATHRRNGDDELPSARSSQHSTSPPPRAAQAMMGVASTQTAQAASITLPGFTTPPQPQDWSYVGAVPMEPLERRVGQPPMSDQQIQGVMPTQKVLSARRAEPTPICRPRPNTTELPFSVFLIKE